jgi:hypothetical protein
MKVRRFLGQYILVDSVDLSGKIVDYSIDRKDGIDILTINFGDYEERANPGVTVVTNIRGQVRTWDLYHQTIRGNHKGVTMTVTCYPQKTDEKTPTKERTINILQREDVPFLQLTIQNLISTANVTIETETDILRIRLVKHSNGEVSVTRI